MKTAILIALGSAACFAGETRLGKPLEVKQPVAIDKLAAAPDQYTGKTVQVRGKVTEVCRMAGCWMELVDPASRKSVRIKVNDGDIVFPKEAIGRMAVAEGKWTKIPLTKEQALARAKHEAEELGRPFRPDTVQPGAIYLIQGTGAVVEEPRPEETLLLHRRCPPPSQALRPARSWPCTAGRRCAARRSPLGR